MKVIRRRSIGERLNSPTREVWSSLGVDPLDSTRCNYWRVCNRDKRNRWNAASQSSEGPDRIDHNNSKHIGVDTTRPAKVSNFTHLQPTRALVLAGNGIEVD